MKPRNSQRFAEIIKTIVQEIIGAPMPEDEKMDKLGHIFALYGYYAQTIGYIEAWKEIMKEQEGKK